MQQLRQNPVTVADVNARGIAPLLFGCGGGVNTAAAAISMQRRGFRPDLVSFADTGGAKSDGGEKPETYAWIETVFRPWLSRVRWPELTVVYNKSPQAGYESLEDDCLQKETMPSRAFGMSSCAMRWKIEPQDRFLTHWPPARAAWDAKLKPIKVLGYDAGEGSRSEIHEDKRLLYWYPLMEWGIDREDCEDIIRSEGLPVPPKSACFYCPSSTKEQVIQLSRKHPDLMARALKIERTALTGKHAPLKTVKGLGRAWSWADLIAADEATRAKMREAPVESCMICDDGGCDT